MLEARLCEGERVCERVLIEGVTEGVEIGCGRGLVNNYLEAIGLVVAHKAGVLPASLSTQIARIPRM